MIKRRSFVVGLTALVVGLTALLSKRALARPNVLLFSINLDPSAQAIIAAMNPSPLTPSQWAARQSAINSTVKALKAKGLWNLFDGLFVAAAHNAQAGLINWKNPSQVAAIVASPTFTVDQGYTGNGTSSYVDTGLKATATGSVGTQNSNHIGVFCLNNVSSNSAGGNAAQSVQPWNPVDGNLYGRAGNASNTLIGATGTSLGYFVVNRLNDASNIQGFVNGAILATVPAVSAALDSVNNMFFCARAPNNFGTYLVSAFHWGAGLTAQNIADAYNILNGAKG